MAFIVRRYGGGCSMIARIVLGLSCIGFIYCIAYLLARGQFMAAALLVGLTVLLISV